MEGKPTPKRLGHAIVMVLAWAIVPVVAIGLMVGLFPAGEAYAAYVITTQLGVVQQTMQLESVTLWIREPE